MRSAIATTIFALLVAICASESIVRFYKRSPSSSNVKQTRAVSDLLLTNGEHHILSIILPSLKHKYNAINQGTFILTSNCALTTRYCFTPLSCDDVVRVNTQNTKRFKRKNVVILCHSAEEKALALARRLNFNVFDCNKTFNLLQKLNCVPTVPTPEKSRFFDKLKTILNNCRIAPLFLCSAMMLVLSGLVGISVFYIVCSSLIFTLAITLVIIRKKI